MIKTPAPMKPLMATTWGQLKPLQGYACLMTLVFTIASWLRLGGTIVLETIAAENHIHDEAALETVRQNQYIEDFKANFMGKPYLQHSLP